MFSTSRKTAIRMPSLPWTKPSSGSRRRTPGLGQIVRLRFYAGLSVEDTAKAMDMSKRSVIRYWTFVRAWLYQALEKS